MRERGEAQGKKERNKLSSKHTNNKEEMTISKHDTTRSHRNYITTHCKMPCLVRGGSNEYPQSMFWSKKKKKKKKKKEK